MVCEIKLTQGKIALVDDEDVDLTIKNWYVRKSGYNQDLWYVSRQLPSERKGRKAQKTLNLHSVIMERILGHPIEEYKCVDHINHDCLDNRRHNLRLVSFGENQYNRRTNNVAKTSRYKGVDWEKSSSKWKVRIQINKRRIFLGRFDSEEDAARAYDKAAKEFFGKFCCLNFPGD